MTTEPPDEQAEREHLAQVMHDTYERARTPGGWLNIADAVIAAGYRRTPPA